MKQQRKAGLAKIKIRKLDRIETTSTTRPTSAPVRVAGALRPGVVRHLLMGTDGLGDDGAAGVAQEAVGRGVETLYLGCNGITAGGDAHLPTFGARGRSAADPVPRSASRRGQPVSGGRE
jgi:hypothetical protein